MHHLPSPPRSQGRYRIQQLTYSILKQQYPGRPCALALHQERATDRPRNQPGSLEPSAELAAAVTAILVSHRPLAVSPISPVFSLSRITSIPFPEGLPGEWARPESHTLPEPRSTSQCFLPPLHRVPAHLPSQNPRGCTFCPTHPPIREIIPPETRLETPKLYYLPIPPIPSVCSTKPRPLPRGLAHPAFSSMHSLRFASTHNTTPLRDGAQEEEGTQGPEC